MMHAYDMYEKVCLLQRIGLPDVSVLDGGFTRWTQLGFDTETGEEPNIQVSLWPLPVVKVRPFSACLCNRAFWALTVHTQVYILETQM